MIDVDNYWLGPFTVGGMSLLDASLAISGHEASEEEFLTKYISRHPDKVADCRTGRVAGGWWLYGLEILRRCELCKKSGVHSEHCEVM